MEQTQERECRRLKNYIQCFITTKLEPHQKEYNQWKPGKETEQEAIKHKIWPNWQNLIVSTSDNNWWPRTGHPLTQSPINRWVGSNTGMGWESKRDQERANKTKILQPQPSRRTSLKVGCITYVNKLFSPIN